MRGKTFLHDIRHGFSMNKARYLLCLFYFVSAGLSIFQSAQESPAAELVRPSIGDAWIQIFSGVTHFTPTREFQLPIPVDWLILHAILLFFTLGYPTQDLYQYGTQILLRTKKRTAWWLSKCMWCTLSVLLFYGIGFLVLSVFSAFSGTFSIQPNETICFELFGIRLAGISQTELFWIALVLPVLTSLTLSLLQMTLTFFLTPVYSYCCIIIYILISIYFCVPICIPNCAMILRSSLLLPGGISTPTALLFLLGILVFSTLLGGFYFSRSDILAGKRKD